MHNQHAGLSQVLAEQRITQRHVQADHARLARGAHPYRAAGGGRSGVGGSWPGGRASPPTSPSIASVDPSQDLPTDGAAAPTRQPHRLAGDRLLA
jgi:hypothetical protein